MAISNAHRLPKEEKAKALGEKKEDKPKEKKK